MKNNIITEDKVISALNKVLLEESTKVKREEFNRIQYKLDELNGSLIDIIREIRKLEDSTPLGLKNVTNSGITSVYSLLYSAEKRLVQLIEKVRQHKRLMYSQRIKEKNI